MTIDEKIEAAISLGENEQGAFMSDELADMLKDEEVSKAYYEHMSECGMCGRVWPLDQLEEPENADVEGMYCLYCVDYA